MPVSIKEISETSEYYVSPNKMILHNNQGHVKRLHRENHKTFILNAAPLNAEYEAE